QLEVVEPGLLLGIVETRELERGRLERLAPVPEAALDEGLGRVAGDADDQIGVVAVALVAFVLPVHRAKRNERFLAEELGHRFGGGLPVLRELFGDAELADELARQFLAERRDRIRRALQALHGLEETLLRIRLALRRVKPVSRPILRAIFAKRR